MDTEDYVKDYAERKRKEKAERDREEQEEKAKRDYLYRVAGVVVLLGTGS